MDDRQVRFESLKLALNVSREFGLALETAKKFEEYISGTKAEPGFSEKSLKTSKKSSKTDNSIF